MRPELRGLRRAAQSWLRPAVRRRAAPSTAASGGAPVRDGGSLLLRFRSDRSGNVAMIVAICLLPMMIAVGAAVDTARLHHAYSKVQGNLDLAIIAAMGQLPTDDEENIRADVAHWFDAQQGARDGTFALDDVRIDLDASTLSATVTGHVPTVLMKLVGVRSMPVTVTSRAAGASRPHTQILFVVDKSASMLLAATPEGQDRMLADIGCTFACHVPDMDIETRGYRTHYDYSKARGILLRADVATRALSRALPVIEGADPARNRIKVGLYRIGGRADQVLAPTSSFPVVERHLTSDAYGMTGSTSDDVTDFQGSLAGITRMVGRAGDGRTAAEPEKILLLVTDGVQSDRHWVHDDAAAHLVAPLNPAWCDGLKTAGVIVAVLYTEYLPLGQDWGYVRTVGATMGSARWREAWGGRMRPGVPAGTTRHDYLPLALADCASSEDLFFSATSQAEIEKGIEVLLERSLSAPRLTH